MDAGEGTRFIEGAALGAHQDEMVALEWVTGRWRDRWTYAFEGGHARVEYQVREWLAAAGSFDDLDGVRVPSRPGTERLLRLRCWSNDKAGKGVDEYVLCAREGHRGPHITAIVLYSSFAVSGEENPSRIYRIAGSGRSS